MGFVARLAVQVVANAAGLVVAAVVLDDVALTAAALLLDVLIFTGISIIVLPMIQKQALRRSEVIGGSSALLTIAVALVVTVWLSDGLSISGLSAWVATIVIVWAVALGRRHPPAVVPRPPERRAATRCGRPDRDDPAGALMAFDIEVGGMVPATMKQRLAQIVGDDAVWERGGHVVITARDQVGDDRRAPSTQRPRPRHRPHRADMSGQRAPDQSSSGRGVNSAEAGEAPAMASAARTTAAAV